MKFTTFEHNGHRHAGVVSDGHVISLASAGFPGIISVLRAGNEVVKQIESFVASAPESAVMPVKSVKLCAPIPRPPKILCMGLNYYDHAIESNMDIPQCPTIFAKYPNTVIGPGDNIVLPKNSAKPDYEAEFAFIIGRGGRHIKAADWRDHVFGYTNFNDVSARDFQMATSQWTMGKNFDTFGPMGPHIVSADEIEDPHSLDISLTLNGEKLQSSNTSELIFKIPETVEFLSSVMTLDPGDVISTGTPAGVGFSHKPPKWLTAGAVVAVFIQGIGELRNSCIAEAR